MPPLNNTYCTVKSQTNTLKLNYNHFWRYGLWFSVSQHLCKVFESRKVKSCMPSVVHNAYMCIVYSVQDIYIWGRGPLNMKVRTVLQVNSQHVQLTLIDQPLDWIGKQLTYRWQTWKLLPYSCIHVYRHSHYHLHNQYKVLSKLINYYLNRFTSRFVAQQLLDKLCHSDTIMKTLRQIDNCSFLTVPGDSLIKFNKLR